MKIIPWINKSLKCKENGRSSDYLPPSYIWGCNGGCKNYCYVYRNQKEFVKIASNLGEIEDSILKLANILPMFKSINQISNNGLHYFDIGCNSDIALYSKKIDLKRILKFYDNHPKLNSTFATKYSELLALDVRDFIVKPRVRISLMPEKLSEVLERGCTPIQQRIKDIKRLQNLGWEVQINYSPVVLYSDWRKDYRELFKSVELEKINVPCEVIMLTAGQKVNIEDFEYNKFLFNKFQENKITKYKGQARRYNYKLKKQAINEFKKIYSQFWNVNTIRYIF